ncbi:MAG: aldose 1-epimerase family protein [Oscillospiraceae bacterium]|nr:aldose 1-epimerase family protein [Oscillospiraceae bacterium]
MKLWGQTYSREELMKNIGDISQVCGVRRSVLDDGPGRGMRVFDVRTGGGLSFSVLPDRGMDISWCSYNDTPIGFISKTGAVSPFLCGYEDTGFLRGFTAGLLTTCGYTHMGAACKDEGKSLGLHGRANFAVAEHASSYECWDGDDYLIRISGATREAAVFGENIQSRREISVKAGENRIMIKDTVRNYGFDTQPLMMLYHFNFGHPLVGPGTKMVSSKSTSAVPRDETASKGLEACRAFQAPTHGYAEQVFYYDLTPEKDGTVFAGLYNPLLNVTASVTFYKNELPYLIQWKQMGEGDYTCGIEPATWKPEGRAAARELGELIMIAPGEEREFSLEVSVITGEI